MAISGSSVFTLGIATGPAPGAKTVEIVAAGVGLLVVALEIAYLPALYNAFSTRETEVTLLATRSGTPSLGPRDPGPPPHARQHRRAPTALRGLGALGRGGVREPLQLSRPHLVPLAGVDPQLALEPGGGHGLCGAVPRRQPAADTAASSALSLHGDQLPPFHGGCLADPLRERPDPDGRHQVDAGRSSPRDTAGSRRWPSPPSATSSSPGATSRAGGSTTKASSTA